MRFQYWNTFFKNSQICSLEQFWKLKQDICKLSSSRLHVNPQASTSTRKRIPASHGNLGSVLLSFHLFAHSCSKILQLNSHKRTVVSRQQQLKYITYQRSKISAPAKSTTQACVCISSWEAGLGAQETQAPFPAPSTLETLPAHLPPVRGHDPKDRSIPSLCSD